MPDSHRELDVLHLLVVRLELLPDLEQLVVDLGHFVLEPADRFRRADSGNHVFALGVDQVVAVKLVVARVGVAGESDARTRVVAGVAENHGLNVDRRPLQTGDSLDAAVLDGLVPHPAIEDGHDRLPELFFGILGKRLLDVLLIDRLVTADQLFEVVGVQVGIELDPALFLEARQFVLERLVLDPHRRGAEHIDQAAIAVVREPRIAGLFRQSLNRGVGQAEVQDRVHHARHRQGRSRAHADQKRISRVAKLLADRFFHPCEAPTQPAA